MAVMTKEQCYGSGSDERICIIYDDVQWPGNCSLIDNLRVCITADNALQVVPPMPYIVPDRNAKQTEIGGAAPHVSCKHDSGTFVSLAMIGLAIGVVIGFIWARVEQ